MAVVSKNTIASLQDYSKDADLISLLRKLADLFPGGVSFSTSFGLEDQVITDIIAKSGANPLLFTLDTGRLFPETYSTWSQTLEKYGLKIRAYYPDKKQLQAFVSDHGPNAFYHSVGLRQSCCYIRKQVPLKKALEGKAIWITGLRAAQSGYRSGLQQFEWDESYQVIKFHPLLNWSFDEVKDYIRINEVPFNPLHEKGFVSIGCAPCTRAIQKGEDFRAGRWWWELDSKKECGLHVNAAATGK